MGARWGWHALCTNGHVYSGFSGGAEECFTCGADPMFEGFCDDGCDHELSEIRAEYDAQQKLDEWECQHGPLTREKLLALTELADAALKWYETWPEDEESVDLICAALCPVFGHDEMCASTGACPRCAP